MPELPEVETTRAGIEPYILNKSVLSMSLRRRDLRWPVSEALPDVILHQKIARVNRRGKYLLLETPLGTLIAHLGMSGSMRIVSQAEPLKKHDHWDLCFVDGTILRYNDPRRFGALFWEAESWEKHELITHLGPEPLTDAFNADYLFQATRGRTLAIKNHIMDSKTVVGVGNIYAAESLFHAGIHPGMQAKKLTKKRSKKLVEEIKRVLDTAIKSGGTTLRDYVNGNGQPGYFQQELWVYGREGQRCKICGNKLQNQKMGQRATVFCTCCQTR